MVIASAILRDTPARRSGQGGLSTAESKPALWRRKSVPAWLGEELVPEVHGRAPRAARTAYHRAKAVACVGRAKAVACVGRTCGPSGSSEFHSGGLGIVFGFALLEPEALAIHLEDMDVMGQAVEERACEAF